MDPLSWLSSSGLYTRFLTADQSTQSMVFKNIQILSKSFWWIGECCAENSNIFISTSAPWVGTGQLLSQPGSALHIGKRMLMDGRNLRVCLLAAAGSRPVALRASSPRLAQLNGIKNQRMVRGQCAGWCRPLAGEFQTTGNIWTHSWCAPSPSPHLTRPVNQYIANLNRFLLKSHFTNLARPAADEAISKQ